MKKGKNAAYKNIVAALQEVNRSRTFRNIGTPERGDLDKAVLLLEELSWKIVSADIAAFAERMGAVSRELAVLGSKIGRRGDHLKKVAGFIKKAAGAAGRAAEIADKII